MRWMLATMTNNGIIAVLGTFWLEEALGLFDIFQYSQQSLENTARELDNAGFKPTSQELYRLNGPRVYL